MHVYIEQRRQADLKGILSSTIIRKQVIMMKTLLLTGFEPFLKFTVNPTMKIVEELHGKVIGNYKIHSEVLTVDFQSSGKQLLSTY